MSLFSAIKNLFGTDVKRGVVVEQDKKDPRMTRVTVPDGMPFEQVITELAKQKEELSEEERFADLQARINAHKDISKFFMETLASKTAAADAQLLMETGNGAFCEQLFQFVSGIIHYDLVQKKLIEDTPEKEEYVFSKFKEVRLDGKLPLVELRAQCPDEITQLVAVDAYDLYKWFQKYQLDKNLYAMEWSIDNIVLYLVNHQHEPDTEETRNTIEALFHSPLQDHKSPLYEYLTARNITPEVIAQDKLLESAIQNYQHLQVLKLTQPQT